MKKDLLYHILLICSIVFAGKSAVIAQDIELDLSGNWRFQIDRNDEGIKERWFLKKFTDNITLPGSMAENRKGDDVTLNTQWTASIYDSSFFFHPRLEKYRVQENLKLPFWLTPVKYYVGAAWYQKEVTIPTDWKNKRIVLFLERPHTETLLWINNKEVGIQNSLSVPHVYEISNFLKTGRNTLTIRVDNRIKEINVGKDSHSITDQTQGNWNGIVGKIGLQTTPLTYIEDLQVYPDLKNSKAVVRIHIEGNASGSVMLEAQSYNGNRIDIVSPVTQSFRTRDNSSYMEIDLPMGDNFLMWDEFEPNLYRLKVTLTSAEGTDIRETRFGMREFTIDGKYFYLKVSNKSCMCQIKYLSLRC